MNDPVHAYLSKIGAKGGKAGTGKSKARSTAHARKAGAKGARVRWKGKK